MLRNCVTAALRNLVRNRLYAAINIVGLAVGFAAAILIALFVRDEFSYDKWIPGYERTYLLYEIDRPPGQGVVESQMTFYDVADWLKLDFPQIQAVGRLAAHNFSFRHGAVETVDEPHYWADPEIFSVLPMKAVAGDIATALNRPDGIVITRRMARKYFGRDDPVGEILEINRQQHTFDGHPMSEMHVTAVIEDLPSNTNLNAEIFISSLAPFSYPRLSSTQHFSADQVPEKFFFTYVRLTPGASIAALRRELPAFVERHLPSEIRGLKRNITFELRPIADTHMHGPGVYGMKTPGSLTMVYALAGVGLLIVVMASINFVNLMTARAARRAIEVGVRKVSGANHRDLIVQFLCETLIYVSLSMALAIALTELALPTLNAILDRAIVFDYWRDPIFIGGIVGVTAIVTLLAGFYPAFVLASFRPAGVLKGGAAGPGSGKVRQYLVILQFAVLIGLTLTTVIIYRQTLYALSEGLRLDKDQVVLVGEGCGSRTDGEAFKEAVRLLPGVRAAACGTMFGTWFSPATQGAGVTLPDGMKTNFRVGWADFGLFELYGLRPLAGRFFSQDHGADSIYPDGSAESAPSDPAHKDARVVGNPPIVINETAVRRLGFATPEAAVGQLVPWIRGLGQGKFSTPLSSEIIGVVQDFSMGSVRDAVDPTFFYLDPFYQNLNIKLDGRRIPETLRQIDRLWDRLGDPSRPISRTFVDQQLQLQYLDITRQSELFAAFAGIAIFIACLGLFGLSSFTAERRTKEIGIRKAMGASQRDVVRLLVWQFSKPVLAANLIAWPVGWYFMHRWLHGFAYHVDLSPWMFLASGAAALVIALGTVSAHAVLVARSKPVTALRYE